MDDGPVRDSRAVTGAAAAIIASGAAWRVWLIPRLPDTREKLGEAYNVARSFAEHGTFSDSFHAGQGPTAHLMPVPAIIAGTVYRGLGIFTPASNLALTVIALTFVLGSFWLLFVAFRDLGSPAAGRLLALVLLSWTPVNVLIEVIWFRVWEGGIAVALAAGVLCLVLRIDRAERIGTRAVVGLSLLAAVTLFLSPPFGVAAYLCAAILMVYRLPPRRWLATSGIAVAAMIVVLAPWTIRNTVVMGAPIVLRDNFGMEIAMANAPVLVDSPDEDGGYNARHRAIHPYAGPEGYAAMIASGGEVAYFAQLQHETGAWIVAHPHDFATLTLRHLRQLLLPDRWMFPQASALGATGTRLAIHWGVSAYGLFGIGYALVRLGRRYRYAAIMTLVPMLPYLIVQPTLRYRYLVFALLTFFAFDLVARLVARLAGGVSPAAAGGVRTAPPAA